LRPRLNETTHRQVRAMANTIETQRKARVIFLAPSFPPSMGGIQQLTYRLCRYSQRLRPEVITPWVEGAREFDARQPIRVIRSRPWLPAGVPGRQPLSLFGRFLSSAASRPDLTFCSHITAGVPALVAKRLFGVPYALFCH